MAGNSSVVFEFHITLQVDVDVARRVPFILSRASPFSGGLRILIWSRPGLTVACCVQARLLGTMITREDYRSFQGARVRIFVSKGM